MNEAGFFYNDKPTYISMYLLRSELFIFTIQFVLLKNEETHLMVRQERESKVCNITSK